MMSHGKPATKMLKASIVFALLLLFLAATSTLKGAAGARVDYLSTWAPPWGYLALVDLQETSGHGEIVIYQTIALDLKRKTERISVARIPFVAVGRFGSRDGVSTLKLYRHGRTCTTWNVLIMRNGQVARVVVASRWRPSLRLTALLNRIPRDEADAIARNWVDKYNQQPTLIASAGPLAKVMFQGCV